ncbi:Crp/Fnr family transcriptional regulator [Thauera sinica]|uniref:Crp/Fnr family transcriptional regulator n=1 Tax=Thauera sinica TaxID=2665146 RepID=A0ABW1AN80_9RHOO|nr:Crp/Fnr family transcriptional regulator [Thauera sp. K11]ATE61790.1 Crp/Fnr family transcriptional regulator [Thauera sp. K11]
MHYEIPAPSIPQLRRIPPFDLLADGALHRLLSGSKLIRAERGEILAQAQDVATSIHIVLDGEVRCVLLSPSGNEKLLRLVGAGDLYGEEAALLGRHYMATVQAQRQTRLLVVPVAAFRHAMAETAAFAQAITMRLAAAAYELMAHLQLCVQLNSTQRVAQYLAQLAPEDAERWEIHLSSDKQTIAAQLNLTPETFSRVLSRFAREGLIRTEGRRRVVLDKLSQLRNCAAQ